MSQLAFHSFSSLRAQAEKWLAAGSDTPLHVRLSGRTANGGLRFVCIEAQHPAGTRTLFFFRHEDGTWRVFPHRPIRPMMTIMSPTLRELPCR
ncbi:hypothetical protein [Caballeronia sp. BR00000012568055]|uniref:hypothetical protein n=1 Tax=Caballeronia sp. BR00000012568055 TaxID=2918761 RepID=UPI0023F92895|nr:hypothetical protein [Caballeronia sp. BR00000012568055]